MKKIVCFVVLVGMLSFAAVLAGEYTTLSYRGVPIALTNTQANAKWSLDGVMISFTRLPVAESTVSVSRVSGGVRYILGATTNLGSTVWWAADGGVHFLYGDSVLVDCGSLAATGTVQVMQGTGR